MKSMESDPGKVLYPVSIALLTLGLFLGFALLPRLFASHDAAAVGKEAPELTLPAVLNAPDDATSLTLSGLRGHPVLLDFWATWCGPCKAEAPLVDAVARRYKDRGLVVVGVNTSDEEGNAAGWAKRHGLSFPIVFDGDNKAARAFGVESLPTLIVIGKTGKIIAVRTGMTSPDELERLVAQAL